MVSDGSSAKGGSGGEGGYGQSEETSDPRPYGLGPLQVDFVFDVWFQMVVRPEGGSGLKVDMAKLRRPRIRGLMGSDL